MQGARRIAGRRLRVAPTTAIATRAPRPAAALLVCASFEASPQRYGSPRICEDLREQHERVSRKRVIRLMQEEGLRARVRRRFRGTTMSDHDQPVAANVLNRQFTADAPNRRWAGDTTEFAIGDTGKLYLAVVMDGFRASSSPGASCDHRSSSGSQGHWQWR